MAGRGVLILGPKTDNADGPASRSRPTRRACDTAGLGNFLLLGSKIIEFKRGERAIFVYKSIFKNAVAVVGRVAADNSAVGDTRRICGGRSGCRDHARYHWSQ